MKLCLDWAGYDVTREFYINDAGNQIEKFGKSLAIRYLQLYKGEDACPLPEECYQGADIIARAKEFAEVHGDAYVNKDFDELKKAIVADALPKNIEGLQRDLGKYRIKYDVWFHESDLHSSGAVKAVVDKLLETGACYKAEDGAIMYRSAQYAAKYGVVNKRKTDDGSEEEAKDDFLVHAKLIAHAASWAHGVCWQFCLPAAPRTAPPPTAPTRWQSCCRLPAQRMPCWSTAATPAFTPARLP